MPSRRFATVVTIVLVIAFAVVAVAPAFAAAAGPSGMLPSHARLLGSTPRDGSTVDTADEVVLQFNEDVDETFVEVTVDGPDGSEVQGEPEVDGRAVTQALSSDLPAGEHRGDLPRREHRRSPGVGDHGLHVDRRAEPVRRATASVTPSPSVTASAAPVPATTPTVEGEPASATGGTAPWVWVLLGGAVLVALGGLAALATRRRGQSAGAAEPGPEGTPVGSGPDTRDGGDDPFA